LIAEQAQKLWDFIRGRRLAYHRVFDKENRYTQTVLQDLARFCRAQTSTFHPDSRVHATLEGRREVWLRIAQQLHLTEEEIYNLHVVKQGEK
jgi:hypothetical protein